LIGAICCLGLIWLFTGGVSIKKIEGYHFETRSISDNELISGYLQGKNHKDVGIPFLFRYVKSLRPFELYFGYRCDEKLYDEITLNSVKLLTSDGQELILSDDQFPITGKFKYYQWKGMPTFYKYSLFFKTSLDIPFEGVYRIDFVIDMTLKKEREVKPYKFEGTLRRFHTDEVRPYWSEFRI